MNTLNTKENHFELQEFGYIQPAWDLACLLNHTREAISKPIIITNGPRAIQDHIRIYKDLEVKKQIKTIGNGLGDKELIDVIPWGSRHLPLHGRDELRAVDIKSEGVTGQELGNALLETARKLGIHIGLGVGKNFCHVDVDRDVFTKWEYKY